MKRPENEKEDEDNDGDDNTDDEYADVDDVYLDENGIIIYDKYGQDDYADPDNVSVDENGIIIYRRNKRNRKKDSLEFKNISYSRFLSILLKNTGWSYVCQPGLENIKHDITVRYDTNIFALLQDSMQSYRGVELEFVHELVGGRVQKVIKAYKDGGRGSFVGKRFEYGTNVRGITKTQEVANSEDDTILYIDNVGINVQYDVDFALKSAEVPEIEIGDTHYVIDRDFYPPMTIKARIGKIEISFSDPTVNKIYLANNKRISGSAVEDELDEDDIADIIDDYDSGDGDYEDYVGYHTHDSLKDSSYDYYVYLDRYNFYPATGDRYNLGTESSPWRFLYTEAVESYNCVSSPRYFGYNYQVYYDREDMEDVKKITNSGYVTKQDLLNFVINDLNVYEYSAIEVNEKVNADVDDPNAYFSNQIYFGLLSDDIVDHGSSCHTSRVGTRIGRGLVRRDTNNDGDQNVNDTHNTHTYNIPSLLCCLIGAFQHYVNGGKPNASSSPKDEEYEYEGGSGYSDPEDPEDPSNPGGGSYGKLICEELRVERADGSAAQADIFGKLYVTEEIKCELTTETNTLKVNTIKFSDGSTMTTAGSGSGSTPGSGNNGGNSGNYATEEYVDEQLATNMVIIEMNYLSKVEAIADYATIEYVDSKLGSGSTPGSGGSTTFDTITVTKIQGPDPGEGQYNRVEFEDAICVNHIWSADEDGIIQMQDELVLNNGLELYGDLNVDGNIYAHNFPASDKSLKENIRYIDAAPTADDLLEKADLHDFIVNQLNICEYNFIGKDDDKIGFIANDYEGTKVGDKIVTRNKKTDLLAYDISNLLFATIGALQEEVRTKDEKIASLEARLAKIEAMLDINNDN